MNTGYHRSGRGAGGHSSGFEEGIAITVGMFLLIIVAFPTVIVGLLTWRILTRYPWGFVLWLALLVPSGALLYALYTHGLESLLLIEWKDYYHTILTSQFDIRQWNLKLLWSDTWPVWLRTFVGFPLVALFQEWKTQGEGGQTARRLRQEELRRLRHVEARKRRARIRTRRPERLPDGVSGAMVMGIPIDDRDQD